MKQKEPLPTGRSSGQKAGETVVCDREGTGKRHSFLERIGLFLVRLASGVVNGATLGALLLCFSFGIYALWDTGQVYQAAETQQYEIYKPTEEDSLSFEELQQRNKEVIGWITVYGTGIDYPIVQAEDNIKYLTTDVGGKFAASGSIFLDYRNSPDFTDFNSILYGHHMDGSAMFGDVGLFTEETYFEEHPYGRLYADGREYGLEFFAMLEADAYDNELYRTDVSTPQERSAYLEKLCSLAVNQRETSVTQNDHIVMLSTCTQDITNGRHVLAAKLLDEVPENTFEQESETPARQFKIDDNSLLMRIRQCPAFVWALLVLALLILILWIYNRASEARRRRKNKAGGRRKRNANE